MEKKVTDKQFNKVLETIKIIVESSSTKEEILEKIDRIKNPTE